MGSEAGDRAYMECRMCSEAGDRSWGVQDVSGGQREKVGDVRRTQRLREGQEGVGCTNDQEKDMGGCTIKKY